MACRPQGGDRRSTYVPQRKGAGYTDPNHSNQANETMWASEAGLLGPSWPGLSSRIDTGHLVSLVPQFRPGGPQPQEEGGDIK